MRLKPYLILLGTIILGLAATSLVITSFAAAQPISNFQSDDQVADLDSAAAAGINVVQQDSVTFPDGDWPWYAQSEITIQPEPPIPGQPAEICVEVINLDPAVAREADLQFGIAPLGIGIVYEPVGLVHVLIPPDGFAHECISWVPPHPGKWGIEVLILQEGLDPERSLHNFDVDEPLKSLEPHQLVFPVRNPFDDQMTIDLSFVQHVPDWEIELSTYRLPNMEPGETREVTLTVTMPENIPPDGTIIVDVEGKVGDELFGGFRKVLRYPVPLHRLPDPPYAEGEISIHPYPLRIGEPTEICVELYNPTPETQTIAVQFSWANFGIGLPFQPINGLREVTLPPYSMVRECIHWIPPVSDEICLQVELFLEGYPAQRSRRNYDVNEPLLPNVPHSRVFPVRNPSDEPKTITLELIPHLANWELELSQYELPNIPAGEMRVITLTVTPPADMPPDGTPIVDVEARMDDELLGGFRKVFRPPVQLHVFPDPLYAEREISVHPYPLATGEPSEICVELRNPTAMPQDATLYFSWAQFGIGLPFQPINGPRMVHLPPFSIVKECIHWVPEISGQACLQVEMEMDGYHPQRSQLNLDVDEPLEPEIMHSRFIDVRNPLDHTADIHLGVIPHLPDWEISLSESVLENVGAGEVRSVVLAVTPTLDMPPDEHPVVDVEAFMDGELIGGFRKIYRPAVPIHRPMDPIYAESEIYIHPYPPRSLEPTMIGVELRNPTEEPQIVGVTFSVASFGIGLPFEPVHPQIVVEVPPFGVVHPEIIWIPPRGGLWCIQVDVEIPGLEANFYSQRNIDVGEPLEPGIPHSRLFEVRNPYQGPDPITITLGIVPHLPEWGLELSPDVLPNMDPDEVREVMLTVIPGPELPPDDHPVVDVEAYTDGVLVGGFRKIYRPPVPVHRPMDPVYAESEIGIDPYPVLPGQPVELSVEVFNPTEEDRIVTTTFSVATFGIGLPFSEAFITPNPVSIFVPAQGAARGHVIWNPPDFGGKFCVRVELESEGHEIVWSQRNIDVGEPLEPGQQHSMVFEVETGSHQEPVTVTLGLIKHKENWDINLSTRTLANVQPGETVSVTLSVTPSTDAELGSGDPIADVEAFVDGQLLGGFRKLDIPPVPLHKPHEKSYAESEISIDPYPPQEGEISTVSTVIQNNSEVTQSIEVEFGWAKFGMGIPFSSTGMDPITASVELGPLMSQTVSSEWTPELTGHQCIQIHLTDPDGIYEPQLSQRNVDVEEPPPCGETKVFTFTVYNDSSLPVTYTWKPLPAGMLRSLCRFRVHLVHLNR